MRRDSSKCFLPCSFSEFPRLARRWAPSAGCPPLADLVPAENLISWKAVGLPVCKLIVMTSAAPDTVHWCPWRLFKKLIHDLPSFFFFPPHSSCKSNTLCCISPGKLTAPSNFLLLCPGLLSVFDNLTSITGSLAGADLSRPHHRTCDPPKLWAV